MRRLIFITGLMTVFVLGGRDAGADIIGFPQAGMIISVTDVDTPGANSVLHTGGLIDGVLGFVDRTYTWADVPASLEGADYIQSAQDNADVSDALGTTLAIDVDVAAGTILHMLIDEPLAAVTPFPWMTSATFGVDWVDSGVVVVANFNDNLMNFNVWSTATPLAAGTYTFRQQPEDASFYGITATAAPTAVPEPATMLLVGSGLVALSLRRRK